MEQAIFTKLIPKTKKYPKRIKVYTEGITVNYVYQESFSEWENHALACQGFCKLHGINGQWYAAPITGGMVFIKPYPGVFVDEFTTFEEDII